MYRLRLLPEPNTDCRLLMTIVFVNTENQDYIFYNFLLTHEYKEQLIDFCIIYVLTTILQLLYCYF